MTGGEVVDNIACWVSIAEVGTLELRLSGVSRNPAAPANGPLDTGWGMSSIVLITVTGPPTLIAFVEPVTGRAFCNVEFAAVQFKDGTDDIIEAPDTTLEGFQTVEDAEVRGDPRAACNPSKLITGSSSTSFILISTYGVESGRITGVGHFA